jgi:hypothetical protein
MTKAEIIRVIIELHDCTYTHDEMMRMTKKQLIDHFYRLADPTRRKTIDERSVRLGMEAQRRLDENWPKDPTKPKMP